MSPEARKIGTWALPSGNSVDVYVVDRPVAGKLRSVLEFQWDEPPSPAWSEEDLAAYRQVVRPAVMRAAALALDVPLSKFLMMEV